MQLIIDNRESALHNIILDRDLDVYADKILIKFEALELGDILIKYQDFTFVFERKTVSDLIASIKDGRYKEQKARLLSNYPLHIITYIIEGDNVIASQSNAKNNIQMLLGAYYHTMFRDNIRIIYTRSIEDTTTFILSFAVKLLDNPDKFKTDLNETYCDVVKMKKRKIDNIDPNVCYRMQLSQIPNISAKIAENIAAAYPSMICLINKLQSEQNYEDRIKSLCKIEKIGKEKAQIVLKYLQFAEE